MRPIKFRVFDKTSSKNGVMVPWRELKLFSCQDVFLPSEIDMPEIILMQYTGLTDKNGAEIYGGDILDSHPDEYVSVNVAHQNDAL